MWPLSSRFCASESTTVGTWEVAAGEAAKFTKLASNAGGAAVATVGGATTASPAAGATSPGAAEASGQSTPLAPWPRPPQPVVLWAEHAANRRPRWLLRIVLPEHRSHGNGVCHPETIVQADVSMVQMQGLGQHSHTARHSQNCQQSARQACDCCRQTACMSTCTVSFGGSYKESCTSFGAVGLRVYRASMLLCPGP